MLNTRTSQLVLLSLVLAWFAAPTFGQQFVFDFEDVQLPTEGFNNGNPNSVALGGSAVTSIINETPSPYGPIGGVVRRVDQTNTFFGTGGDLVLNTSYFEADGFDDFFFGFSFSNVQDTITPGPDNRYAAFPGSGAGGSSNYIVGGVEALLTSSREIVSIDIAPTSFTALAILNGDDGGSGFVDEPLTDSDGFFELVITGDNSNDEIRVSFGDYRNGANVDPAQLFQTYDVSSLNSTQLSFTYDGSDRNQFGLLTPQFFAADNIVISVPEPSGLGLLSLGGLAAIRRRRR